MQRRKVFVPAVGFPVVLALLGLSGCIPFAGGPGTNPDTTPGGVFNLPPTVVLTATPQRGVAPLTVLFSSAGSTDDGLIVERLWDFGDGQTSQDISPQHIYQTTGQFTVKLTLVDDLGARSSRTQTVSVTDQPIAVIQVDRTAAESAPAVFQFDGSQSRDPDGSIVLFQWDFGDGSRELLPAVSHTFASPGTFRVRLTVTDNTGVTGVAETTIEVGIPRPRIAFGAPPATINNLVLSNDSPLWVYTTFQVTPGTPYRLSAGLDGDNDACDAKAVSFRVSDGATLQNFTGHTDRVRAVAFSPDGSRVLTGSEDRTLRLYDAASGLLLRTYGGNTGAVTSVAFSPDGTLFVYGVDDGSVTIRNVNTGSLVRDFAGHTGACNAVAFAPNGARVASGGDDNRAIVWNVADGSIARQLVGHTATVTSVAFSPLDPTQVLTGSVDQTARLWDVNTGVTLVSFAPVFNGGQLVSGHSSSVNGVAFAPDAAQIITCSDDRTAKLWNVSGGPEVRTFTGHSNRVASCAFAPGGAQIATGSYDATARLWNVSDGAQVRSVQPCTSRISSVAFSADGATLLCGVAAKNSIPLNTIPDSGNDLNLTQPTPLVLTGVAPGAYSLWAEIQTDRTAPVRTYAGTAINVVADYTASIDTFTPRIPLINDRAAVIVAPTTQRQIFDLGPLSAGDRIRVSLLSLPGYGDVYATDPDYSVLIVDSDQKMFAWLQNDPQRDLFTQFSQNTNLIIGHNSQNYYLVIDSGTSVNLSIQRGVGASPVPQRIYLNFAGTPALGIGGQPPVPIDPFDASDYDNLWGPNETLLLENRVLNVMNSLFATVNVEITASHQSPPPEPPYLQIYFGGTNIAAGDGVFGYIDGFDPRNSTLGGTALVSTLSIDQLIPGLTLDELGFAFASVAARQTGLLMGLRLTTGASDIMSVNTAPTDVSQIFTVNPLNAADQTNGQFGQQDAPQILQEVVGTP